MFISDFLNGLTVAGCLFVALGLYIYLLISDKGNGK